MQENRGQGRLDAHRVLPGPGYSVPRGSAGSSTAAAKRGEEARPRPKIHPRASSVEAPNTDAREVERLAHRVEQYSQRMAELLRRGVLELSMVCAFLMTKGGQQETAEVSHPRPPPERPPIVFARGETLALSSARPKVRILQKSRPRNAEETIEDPAQE